MRILTRLVLVSWLSILAGCQPASPPPPGNSGAGGGSSTTGTPRSPRGAADVESAPENEAPPESPATKPSPETPATNTDSSSTESRSNSAMSIEKTSFGKTSDGQEVSLFTCRNAQGLVMKLTDYGATVVSFETPDRDGKLANITLGYADLAGYLNRHPYFGSTVGRYANRIAGGKFTLDGQEYQLAVNNDPNHLHGGKKGLDALVWQAAEVKTDDAVGVKFALRSPDGDENYPGNLDVVVTYVLTDKNEMRIDYEAKTDKPTIINLTNHCYWNLAGGNSGKILDHELMIAADKYVPVNDVFIPTGELAPVAGTVFDFTTPHKIGERIEVVKTAPHTTKGYDHCFVLRGGKDELGLAARVKDPSSGRVMEVYTTEPGIQFYSGNMLDGSPAQGNHTPHDAFCLETQHYPDSPNHPDFPSTRLAPDQTFRSTTVHKFLVE